MQPGSLHAEGAAEDRWPGGESIARGHTGSVLKRTPGCRAASFRAATAVTEPRLQGAVVL